jgi:hypothetical protein
MKSRPVPETEPTCTATSEPRSAPQHKTTHVRHDEIDCRVVATDGRVQCTWPDLAVRRESVAARAADVKAEGLQRSVLVLGNREQPSSLAIIDRPRCSNVCIVRIGRQVDKSRALAVRDQHLSVPIHERS